MIAFQPAPSDPAIHKLLLELAAANKHVDEAIACDISYAKFFYCLEVPRWLDGAGS
jgi:hypothetical protein